VASKKKTPSLKSASGAGFSFEDQVAASLMCEMLAGQGSLGKDYGIVERVERQANDWEPFGDILVTAADQAGEVCKIGGSVKSNRQISANGSSKEFSAGIWEVTGKKVFTSARGALALYSAPLSADVTDQLEALCRQARQLESERLDEKVVHENSRKIYDSFRNAEIAGVAGLPGLVLKHFIVRQFDFEATTSKSEAEALRLCREILIPESRNDAEANRLWQDLLAIAHDLRVSGGAVTRETLAAKLRNKFQLLDDPSDVAAWSKIRKFSRDGLDEITIALPGGISVPRKAEHTSLATLLAKSKACSVLGDSGFGKSALVKRFAAEREGVGDEVVWLKAERISILDTAVPNFEDIARRTRRASGLLIIDAIEGCYDTAALGRLSRLMKALVSQKDSIWSLVVICQTREWARVSGTLISELGKHAVLTERLECGPLSDEDFDLVRAASASVDLLAHKSPLRLLLKSPKMLDVLLTGQLAENRELAGEADLVEWWWKNQVQGGKQITAEERVARHLAERMAEELRSELPPDSVSGAEDAANNLIQKRVLKRTREGLLRFDHDLLADWSRVMHLKALGHDALAFIRAHTQNPPWLRAVRLLSQHLLDRVADLDRWREVLRACSVADAHSREPSAEDLQVIDAWLEGIIFSLEPRQMLEQVHKELFADNGWRLRRLIQRLMYVGTIPDPVMQERLREMDADSAEMAAEVYRLPILGIWTPVINFLIDYADQVVDVIPLELGETGTMWGRMGEYLNMNWPRVANLVISNAEKELRREVAGEYRSHRGSHGRGNKGRIAIYSGALYAASQDPERVAKLLLKASGRLPWDDGDLSPQTDGSWRSEWHERGSLGFGQDYVETPVTAWPDGPTRKTSDDFFHAWFDTEPTLILYRERAQAACEATLGFLIDWPKRRLFPGHHSMGADRYGFTFEADHMYPPFYTKGPFLRFLRHDWKPALDLIVRLTNFATERYADWWPYEPKPTSLQIPIATGKVSWLGNHQVYVWHRQNWNTPQVVTCALMALEKWFEDQLAAKQSIKEPVEVLYRDARSLAFAGLLISLGKRHPEVFIDDLKPLLFIPQFYTYDFSASKEYLGGGFWPRDGAFINDLRREWNGLPGRKTPLLDASCSWFISRPKIRAVLSEVSENWRKAAEKLQQEDQLVLFRLAARFDLRNWTKSVEGTQELWQWELPKELQDVEAEQANTRRQANLTIPYHCSDLLEKRPRLDDQAFEGIRQQLHDWPAPEASASSNDAEHQLESSLLDDKHARAGLLSILLCLGDDWLDKDPERRRWVEGQVKNLFLDPPKIAPYSEEEIHDDAEGFLARCAIRCWAQSPDDEQWRSIVAGFVGAFRYRTIEQLFDEAFRVREILGANFRGLEALAVSFAIVRRRADLHGFKPKAELIGAWGQEWIPRFAKKDGPVWTEDWATIEHREDFPPAYEEHYGPIRRQQLARRDFGLDMGVILAAFGALPSLDQARDNRERGHWLNIAKQILAAYIRTLPSNNTGETDDEWRLEPWSVDEKIFQIIAARLFQSSPDDQRSLWLPILNLPPAAHFHITQFLDAILIEAIREDPPRISNLLPLWRAIAEYLLGSPRWTGKLKGKEDEVWQHIFLYGTPFSSVGDKDHAPFVAGLRDLFAQHIRSIDADPYDHSSFAAFLTTEAGEQLAVDALEWLGPSWQKGGRYFWERAVERSHFETLLRRAWKNHFSAIRENPEALKAFKILTLNLATEQVPIAIDIQRQIGGS